MEFSIDALEAAVHQFYQSNINSPIQAQAHEWLEKAKNSQEAWVFVWLLLHPQKTFEVQFFAANTLHTKIIRSLHELVAENIIDLKQRLLSTILIYTEGPKMVLNKLCISLSAYLMLTYSEEQPDVLPTLLVTFTPENLPQVSEDKILWILFEILTVLSEEFSTMHIKQHHKGLLRYHFIENTPSILSLLEKVLTTHTDQEVITQALKCASSWITIGVPITEYQNLCNLLVNLIFSTYKHHSSICEKALDFLKVVVDLPENYKFSKHLLELLGKILPLGKIIEAELTLEKKVETEQKLISNIYQLFLFFGSVNSKQCLTWIKEGGEARQKVLSLISYILQCSGAKGYYPKDETYSRLTFGFWYVLQDEILLSSSKDRELYMLYLGPVYKELVNTLIIKAQLPEPELNFSKQDLESFRCYRQDISDTLMYCHSILHETTISLIQSKLEKINVNISKWQELEACLFSLSSISENVDIEENTFLPSLFQYIRNLPFQALDPKVFSTALDTIGAYASWISAHSSTLEHVLPLIILGLNVPETISSATMALKDLARDCQYDIKPYSSLILHASQKALHGGRLKLNDSQRLMFTVGLLLSVLPLETVMHYLNIILTPYIYQLNSLASQEPSPQIRNNIILCLKMIGVLSANLNTKPESNSDSTEIDCHSQSNEPQPVLLILQELLPVIKIIADSWSGDEQVIQALFLVLKQCVITLLEDAQPVVIDILNLIVSTYRVHPQPSALDLSKTLCTLFGKDEKYQFMMQSLTNELCTVAMTGFSAQNLSDCTDLLEALFTYLAQITKKVPKLILSTDSASLFQCATVTLGLPELPTVKSAALFLINFILQSADIDNLQTVVNVHGQQLVLQIITCIAGEASRSNIEPLAGIFLALNKTCIENNSVWLRQSVTKDTCPRTSSQQRENFISMVLRIQRNKDQLQETVKKFSLTCRGLI